MIRTFHDFMTNKFKLVWCVVSKSGPSKPAVSTLNMS